MEAKDVLDNFVNQPSEAEELKKVIWEALNILENDRYATRAYNAAELLRNAMAEYGEPDYDGE